MAFTDDPKSDKTASSSSAAPVKTGQTQPPQKSTAALEEDDEFEDFPVEDWPAEETESGQQGSTGTAGHLWEKSWDDDDTSDDFSKQLRAELKKVEAAKRR